MKAKPKGKERVFKETRRYWDKAEEELFPDGARSVRSKHCVSLRSGKKALSRCRRTARPAD